MHEARGSVHTLVIAIRAISRKPHRVKIHHLLQLTTLLREFDLIFASGRITFTFTFDLYFVLFTSSRMVDSHDCDTSKLRH